MSDIVKAYLKIEGQKDLDCLFNPESYTVTKRNEYKDSGATDAGGDSGAGSEKASAKKAKRVQTQEFTGTDPSTLALTLIFDTTETGQPVTTYTSRILDAMEVKQFSGTSDDLGNERPPRVKFGWGQQISWWAVITSATIVFEFFSSSGVPLRAKVTLDLKQAEESKAFTRQNPTSGTPRPHRVHRVQRGETLDRISARYYGDSTRWRTLAAANGVEDPLGLRPGALLAIPELGA